MRSSGDEHEEPARFRAHAAVIHRNRFLGPIAVTAAVLGPVAAAIGVTADLPLLAALSPLLLAAGVGGSVYAFSRNPWTSEVVGDLEAGKEGVLERGRLYVARDQIRAGFLLPDPPRGPRVRIQRKWRLPIEIRVRNEVEGRALLRALGLDATQRAAEFFTPSRAMSDPRWAIVLGVGFAALSMLLGGFDAARGSRGPGLQIPIVAAYLGFLFLTRTSLTVGADGILRSWLGKKEFWSYGDIESVKQYIDQRFWRKQKWEGIELVLRSGDSVRIPVSAKGWRNETGLELIIQRVRDAMESHRHGDPAADTALLARQTRTVSDWIQRLRAIGSGAHLDHRTAPVEPERLFRIVEDPSAAPSARAGAAVALATSLDADGKLRLEGVAEAIASPKLRIAIHAAAGGDDAALTEALSAIEGEPQKRARA
jgi:hypothetical protein